MPTRDEHKPVKVISDLDALISQPIGFKYLGKDHIIEPMTTENYIEVCQGLYDMDIVARRKEDDPEFEKDAIYAAYFRFIHSVCKTITLEDLKKAKIAQLHALIALIIKHVKGETSPDMIEKPSSPEDLEKKKMK